MKYQTLQLTSVAALIVGLLGGCASTTALLPSAGPSVQTIQKGNEARQIPNLDVIQVDENVVMPPGQTEAYLMGKYRPLWPSTKPSLLLGQGDGVTISIFETPPAVLLSGGIASNLDGAISTAGGQLQLPEQMINASNTLTVPFVGQVKATGRTLQQIEAEIKSRLNKIANNPYVVARLTTNNSNTVVSIVDGKSEKIALTSKGEKIMDAIAQMNGANKIEGSTVQITRNKLGSRYVTLQQLTKDPRSNVYLLPGDVISIVSTPYSATVLGASGSNAEVRFGDEGMTLSSLLGRVGGTNDARADARGIFIYRKDSAQVFQLDLSRPDGYMLAQRFPVKDRDLVYVANAPSVEYQKFLNLIFSPVNSLVNTVKTF